MHGFLQTYKTLLHHTWLGFRRAHYFQRSLGTKMIIGFVALTILFYMFILGTALPGLLQQLFPEKSPLEAFFSFLLFIYFGDFILRYFMQKLPKQQVEPYLHLPVKRSLLAIIILLRSWFTFFNLYLFALLVPLFARLLLPTTLAPSFITVIAGCFLLGGINHSLIIWLKAKHKDTPVFSAIVILLALLLSAAGYFFREYVYHFSEFTGSAFIQGKIWAFLAPIIIITGLQKLTFNNLKKSLYLINSGIPVRKSQASGPMERLFTKVPVYGLYWELEWKLLNRNKRASMGLRQWPLTLLLIPMFFYFSPGAEHLYRNMFIFIMVAGGYGFFHLQYAYSWESRFFDFIASRNIDIRNMIQAKYYFYCILAIMQLLILLPVLMFMMPEIILPYTGMTLFVIGPVFAFLLNQGISYSTRINPNKKAYFNTEGTSGTQFLSILLIMLSYFPFLLIAYILPLDFKISLSLVLGSTGIAFLAAHQRWIKSIAKKFEQKKYISLKKYRQG
jgi:hypothetical protein